MPNWVDITTTFSGDSTVLDRIEEGIREDRGILRTLLPMPTELEGTQAPGNPNAPEAVALREKYGFANWYDWQHANWGVKWGDCETHVVDRTPNTLKVFYQVPWGEPAAAWRNVTREHDVVIINTLLEESGAFVGITAYRDGENILEDVQDIDGYADRYGFDVPQPEGEDDLWAWWDERARFVQDRMDTFVGFLLTIRSDLSD